MLQLLRLWLWPLASSWSGLVLWHVSTSRSWVQHQFGRSSSCCRRKATSVRTALAVESSNTFQTNCHRSGLDSSKSRSVTGSAAEHAGCVPLGHPHRHLKQPDNHWRSPRLPAPRDQENWASWDGWRGWEQVDEWGRYGSLEKLLVMRHPSLLFTFCLSEPQHQDPIYLLSRPSYELLAVCLFRNTLLATLRVTIYRTLATLREFLLCKNRDLFFTWDCKNKNKNWVLCGSNPEVPGKTQPSCCFTSEQEVVLIAQLFCNQKIEGLIPAFTSGQVTFWSVYWCILGKCCINWNHLPSFYYTNTSQGKTAQNELQELNNSIHVGCTVYWTYFGEKKKKFTYFLQN